MPFSDFFSPILRHKILTILVFIVVFGIGYIGFLQIPHLEKTTIFFSVKPRAEKTPSTALDPAESTMKIVQSISGWAKNPHFREEILKTAGVHIPKFKRKISARKIGFNNAAWTIKLWGDEAQHNEKIAQATIQTIHQYLDEFNQNNAFPFDITTPKHLSEPGNIPQHWGLMFFLFLGIFIGIGMPYLIEMVRGKTSFISQIKAIFPKAPILQIPQKIGFHDAKILQTFLSTFENPILLGTFQKAQKHFDLVPHEKVVEGNVILMVQLGETNTSELQNFHAIFGKQCGIVVFQKN